MLRIVKTENGLVRGIPAADPRITAFKGIPFAAPPVGDLRWKAPQPAADWEGIRDCYTFGPIAMQETPGEDPNSFYAKEWHVDPEIPMSEDCLQLNVWTPAKTGDEKLPVMVWIYGGGLMCGYPAEMEFDGERIARRGVILVSVNYRVNVFGFLAHPEITAEDPTKPANFGFMDQQAGIRWVKRNIAAFGGDPDNITVFGQSAGGGSTMVQTITPTNKGLFQKAIVHSGGGMLPPTIINGKTLAEAEETGKEFFKDLGVSTLEEARALDAKVVLKQALSSRKYGWGTVIGDAFVPEKPSYAVLNNRRNDVDIITGNTVSEFQVVPRVTTEAELDEYAKNLYGEDADRFLEIVKKDANGIEDMIKNATYNRFRLGNLLWVDANVRLDAGKMYFYTFHPEIPGDDAGSFHSSDLWFAFETLAKCWRPFKGKHYDLARQMCNYWTNFAKTGDPNGLDADGTAMPEWKEITKDQKQPIFFGDTAYMDEAPRTELENFLVDYYAKRLDDEKPIGFMAP